MTDSGSPQRRNTLGLYGAAWCPDCRALKQVLARHLVPYVFHDVDVSEEARARIAEVGGGRVRIPTVEIDCELLVDPPLDQLLSRLGIDAADRRPYYDVVIVVGGPTGLTAAMYTSRESLDTLVLERAGVGGQAAITQIIENFPGFDEGIGGAEFVARLHRQAEKFGAEVMQGEEVAGVRREGQFLVVATVNRREIVTRAVLVATGSRYREMGIPGEQQLIGRHVHFCATCDGPLYEGKQVMVIGAGDSGFEESLHLMKFATGVTIVARSDEIKASQILQDKVAEKAPMRVVTNRAVEELLVEDGALAGVRLKDLASGEVETHTPDGVFVFIGLRPNAGFLPEEVVTDARGFVRTDDTFATSMTGLYAAGDVRVGSTKQAVAAAGEGTGAAIAIRRYLQSIGEAYPTDHLGSDD